MVHNKGDQMKKIKQVLLSIKWFVEDWIATIETMRNKKVMASLKTKTNKVDYISLSSKYHKEKPITTKKSRLSPQDKAT